MAGNFVPTDLPTSNLNADIDPVEQSHGLWAAHELARDWYESLGYQVSIDLV
jgi:hypothetical protein